MAVLSDRAAAAVVFAFGAALSLFFRAFLFVLCLSLLSFCVVLRCAYSFVVVERRAICIVFMFIFVLLFIFFYMKI